jgi:hypothetical protein
MKKLIILLAAAVVSLSTMAFAEGTNPNDVLQTVPGASDKAVMAEAATEASPEAEAAPAPAKATTKQQLQPPLSN